jgi:hypothetical protein
MHDVDFDAAALDHDRRAARFGRRDSSPAMRFEHDPAAIRKLQGHALGGGRG